MGHAGFRIDTEAGSILCDPWVNPAYFASWFPFPDNSALDWDALGDVRLPLRLATCTRTTSTRHCCARTSTRTPWCCCPTIPVPDLRRELEKVGFHRFFETTDSVKHRVSGPKGDLDVMIIALRAPADGPIGDSGLVVDRTATTVCFNMNDARPVDLDVLARRVRPCRRAHAAVLRGHLVPDGLRHAGAAPRRRSAPRSGSARWTAAASTSRRSARPGWCPSAGPPCFLDPELRDLNDDHGDPANIFPDQVGVPGPDAPPRARPRAVDDSRVDGGFHRLAA